MLERVIKNLKKLAYSPHNALPPDKNNIRRGHPVENPQLPTFYIHSTGCIVCKSSPLNCQHSSSTFLFKSIGICENLMCVLLFFSRLKFYKSVGWSVEIFLHVLFFLRLVSKVKIWYHRVPYSIGPNIKEAKYRPQYSSKFLESWFELVGPNIKEINSSFMAKCPSSPRVNGC